MGLSSTMRTLIGGTMLGSVGFDFLIGEGDAAFSPRERRLPEAHLAGVCLAPVGDVRGDEGGEAVFRRTSIAPVLFATWRAPGEVPVWPAVAGTSPPGIAAMSVAVPESMGPATWVIELHRCWTEVGRFRKVTPPAGRVRSAESECLRLPGE